MSLFDGVPSEFPLDIDLTKRPVSYTLRANPGDRNVVIILSAFWLVFGALGIFFGIRSYPEAIPILKNHIDIAAAGLVAIYVAVIGGWWFWPQINAGCYVAEVNISDFQVDVTTRDVIRRDHWSCKLADFEGVALLNLGTHELGERKFPIASVVLKHPDPARSVPVAINAAEKIGRKTVVRKAHELNLPVLEGVGYESGEAAYPAGTVIVNRFQSLKVRALYWSFAAIAAGSGLASLYQLSTGSLDSVWPILFVVFLPLAVGMHIYATCYIVNMAVIDDAVWIQTAALLSRRRRIDPQKIVALEHREGHGMDPTDVTPYDTHMRMATHTPWIKLRVQGRALPFIVDMQADYVDEKKLSAVRSGLRIVKGERGWW